MALLVLVFLPLIIATSRWLPTWRIDLTADQLYTLTPGTVHIIDTLRVPLHLTLYFSAHAARDLPQLRSYELRVREMLQEMVARADGRIHLQLIDPVPYSDDEASAQSSGLVAANGGSNGERVFFGLAANTGSGNAEADAGGDRAPGKSLSIPFFDPSREAFLEYDISRLLYELNESRKPVIGVISSLPVEGDRSLGEPPWTIMRQLDQLFAVSMLDPASLKQIDHNVQVLLVIQPRHLPVDAQYAIDQYLMQGGHLIVFVDPDAELDTSPYGPNSLTLPDHGSDLPRLFKAWGVIYNPTQVVLDRSLALPIELDGNSFKHPAMLSLGTRELNLADPITASLQSVNVSTAGHFDLAPLSHTRLVPLLQSSSDAALVPTQRVLDASNDPTALLRNYQVGNANYVLAAHLRGSFVSAFPERASDPGHRSHAVDSAKVILVADTDLLSDRLWAEPQAILGQTMMRVFADNGDFVTNMVDHLSGSSALLSIRSRSTSRRPFTRVQALRNAADRKFLQKERELEQELADMRRRVNELRPDRSSGVGAEQRREIEQFRQRQLAITSELRGVQHQLNDEIDALGLRIKVINISVIPGLVILFGLVYGWRRMRRSRRR
ncbi:MAG: Gldg family protein [Rhodanobacter sp.]